MNSGRQGTLEAISEVSLYPSLKYCCFMHNAKSPQSCPTLSTPWTVACQAPLSMGLPRQAHWSGLPCLPPGDLLNPGIEPESLKFSALASGFFTKSTTWETPISTILLFSPVVIKQAFLPGPGFYSWVTWSNICNFLS